MAAPAPELAAAAVADAGPAIADLPPYSLARLLPAPGRHQAGRRERDAVLALVSQSLSSEGGGDAAVVAALRVVLAECGELPARDGDDPRDLLAKHPKAVVERACTVIDACSRFRFESAAELGARVGAEDAERLLARGAVVLGVHNVNELDA